jgi:hypothetical protein
LDPQFAKLSLLHLAITIGVLPWLFKAADGNSKAAIGPTSEALRLPNDPFVLEKGGRRGTMPNGEHTNVSNQIKGEPKKIDTPPINVATGVTVTLPTFLEANPRVCCAKFRSPSSKFKRPKGRIDATFGAVTEILGYMHVLGMPIHSIPLVRCIDAIDIDLHANTKLPSQPRGIIAIVVVENLVDCRSNGNHRWAIWWNMVKYDKSSLPPFKYSPFTNAIIATICYQPLPTLHFHFHFHAVWRVGWLCVVILWLWLTAMVVQSTPRYIQA